MADREGKLAPKNYHIGIKPENKPFHVKGMEHSGWGMKRRLSRIFNTETGRTLMLAFDHGYIMGATRGLERLDISIPPLIPYADCLMGTRGGLRTCITPANNKAVALRCSAGSSVLKEDMSYEVVGVKVEDALRMDASCMAVQAFIGANGECQSINNIVKLVNKGNRYGMPVLGVVAVGKEMERTPEYFLLATRILAELGVSIVKTYYCEGFEKITSACPVPVVIAGGKKVPEKDALEITYRAVQEGAAGVDMGRNVFQAENPVAMIQAVRSIVHHGENVEDAYRIYEELKRK